MERNGKRMRRSVLAALAALLAAALLCLPCLAAEETGGSVYASPGEQAAIAEMIGENGDFTAVLAALGVTVAEESITPVYTVDLEACAAAGKFSLEPWTAAGTGRIYAAKTLTAAGEYAGNLRFGVAEGKAEFLGYSPSAAAREPEVPGAWTPASCFWADHADRAMALLGLREAIPEEAVRYVVFRLGNGFCITLGETEVILWEGYESLPEGVPAEEMTEVGKLLEEAAALRREGEEPQGERPEEATGGSAADRNGGAASETGDGAGRAAPARLRYSRQISVALCAVLVLAAAAVAVWIAGSLRRGKKLGALQFLIAAVLGLAILFTAVLILASGGSHPAASPVPLF